MNFTKLGHALNENSTHILTGVAVAGVVGTTVLAVRATPRVTGNIEDYRFDKQAEMREEYPAGDHHYYEMKFRDYLKIGWRPYLPAALVGAGTIACIIGINAIGTRRSASLAAGAALTSKAFQEYREAIVEKIGVDKEEEVRADILERKLKENPNPHEVIVKENGKSMFFDTFSNRYFFSTMADVEAARNEVNFEVINNNYATMNDFYREIGLAQIAMGDEFGWTSTNKMDIYFTAIMSPDKQAVVAIDYYNSPVKDYTNPFAK